MNSTAQQTRPVAAAIRPRHVVVPSVNHLSCKSNNEGWSLGGSRGSRKTMFAHPSSLELGRSALGSSLITSDRSTFAIWPRSIFHCCCCCRTCRCRQISTRKTPSHEAEVDASPLRAPPPRAGGPSRDLPHLTHDDAIFDDEGFWAP